MDGPVRPPPGEGAVGHVAIIGALVGVVVLDVFLSLVVWDVKVSELWWQKSYALTGMYLWAVPVATVMSGYLIWWPWQPFVWLAALGMATATWFYGRGVHQIPRILYALLMALVVSGFAVVRWSTIGD